MAGTIPRRAALGAAATVVAAAAVLATPSLASAQSDPTTTVDHHPTTTASTTTTSSTTTTITGPPITPPPPPELRPVHAPGESFTRSGTGCLIGGEPGLVAGAVSDGANSEEVVTRASATGAWSVTFTVPAHFREGGGAAAVVCGNETGSVIIPVDLYLFVIQNPGRPAPPLGSIDDEVRAAKGAAQTKVQAPKSVKSKPTYTG